MSEGIVTVLIAEDEALVAVVIKEALASLGLEVIGRAADGRSAVELTEKLRPDVVLMDVQMPEMDGISAAEQIQHRCPTPIVMLTVHHEQQVAARAAKAGVGAYLIKPPEPGDLMRAITVARARFDDLMELRRLNAELHAALDSVKTLSGMLPICASCKKIRDDKGYWHQVDVYIRDHSSTEFTHGICPDCMERLYPPEECPWLYEERDG